MSGGSGREITGFLCRWCLLGGTGTAVAAMAWVSVGATARVGEEIGAQLTMASELARPAASRDGQVALRGYLGPPAAPGSAVALAVAEGQPMTLVRAAGGQCRACLRNPQAGSVELLVRGMPYSAWAFQARRCWLVCIPGDARVFLVDARMDLAGRRGQPDLWRACRLALADRGKVVLFHPGPKAAFDRCAGGLTEAGAVQPVLFDDDQPAACYTLRRAIAALARPRGAPRPEIVTGDAELALQAARMGLTVHLVCADTAGAKPTGRLRRHSSLAKLKVSLSSRPISLLR